MITISKSFEWDMGHRVTNHISQCKNLHGHRYKMIVEITGPVSEISGASQQGMIVDFGDFKRMVESNLVAQMDHSFMYWDKDDLVRTFAEQNKTLKWNSVSFIPTAESIAGYCAETIIGLLKHDLPDVTLVSVSVYETPTSQATWRPGSV